MAKRKPVIEPRRPPVTASVTSKRSEVTQGVNERSQDISSTRRPLKSLVTRSDGSEVKKLSVYISVEVAAELEAYCKQSGRNFGHVVNEAIQTLLTKR